MVKFKLGLASSRNIMVKHMHHHPMVEGSSQAAAAASTRRERQCQKATSIGKKNGVNIHQGSPD